MKMVHSFELIAEAGMMMPIRDMSAYDGKEFDCACGRKHSFNSTLMSYRNFGTTGANARMIVSCPLDSSYNTLIQTKYKFLVVFDKFISIAGSNGD
jgi:hypothetical protein